MSYEEAPEERLAEAERLLKSEAESQIDVDLYFSVVLEARIEAVQKSPAEKTDQDDF